MIPLKIGDKVTIRRDLNVGDTKDELSVARDMLDYRGKTLTIRKVFKNFRMKTRYKLEGAKHAPNGDEYWIWDVTCFDTKLTKPLRRRKVVL